MKKFSSILTALTFFALLTLSSAAFAGTATANLSVSVTVDSACSVNTSPLTFSTYEPLGTNLLSSDNTTGSVIVTCTAGTSATIEMGSGGHASGGQSRMASSGNFINYNLYQDGSRSIAWGSGAAAMILSPAPDMSPRSFTVYGQIPAGQTAASGAYADTVVVAVNF